MHRSHIHHLPAGQTQTLHPPAGAVLRVQDGRLWITQTGSPEDHFLSAGGVLHLARGRVVVQAEGGVPARYVCTLQAGAPAARQQGRIGAARIAPLDEIPDPPHRENDGFPNPRFLPKIPFRTWVRGSA